ncbi:helix-turn-helix domain-containing protein [Pseudomonas shirazensis]
MVFKTLSAEKKKFYFEKFESILISRKLFLKNDFSLPKLAQETGIQLHVISHVVNCQTNYNFNDYVNLMRIQYFKEKISDIEWKDLRVKEMVQACGFKSRTTAYRAFIRHIGMSPSDYLKLNRS